MSLINKPLRLYDYNMTSCLWWVIDTTYLISISFFTMFGVCFVSLSLFMLKGYHIPICLRVTIFQNCDLSKKLPWWILGPFLHIIVFYVIGLRTSDLGIICFSSPITSIWVLLGSTLSSYPTILLQFYAKLLYFDVPLIWCPSNVILSQ